MSNEQLSFLPESQNPDSTEALIPDELAAREPRLTDPELDALWQAERAEQRHTVSTSSLSAAEQNANERRAIAEHRRRTQQQITEPYRT